MSKNWKEILQPYWDFCWESSSMSIEEKELELLSILSAYQEEGRFYHSASHLYFLFQEAEKNLDIIKDPVAFYLSIWYHDVIYNPKSSTNEEDSAERAYSFVRKHSKSTELAEKVKQWILFSSHKNLDLSHDPDAQLFVDLDLGILASSPETYKEYVNAVRREYAHVPHLLFIAGRAKMILSFLSKRFIYQTPKYQSLWEETARKNLSSELI